MFNVGDVEFETKHVQVEHCEDVSTIKAGFHTIAMIVAIAVITETNS